MKPRSRVTMVAGMSAIGVLVCMLGPAWAEDRKPAAESASLTEAEKEVPAEELDLVIEGLEGIEPEVQKVLAAAVREFLAPKAKQLRERVPAERLVGGLSDLWLSDPEIARCLEGVAHDVIVAGGGVPAGDAELSLWDDGDRIVFRVAVGEVVYIIEMVNDENGMLQTTMVHRVHLQQHGAPKLQIRVLEGLANAEGDEGGTNSPQGLAAAGPQDPALPPNDAPNPAHNNSCASTDRGVCCSLIVEGRIRIVCMCHNQQGDGFARCGDTGWLK